MKPSQQQNFVKTLITVSQLVLLSACASATEEAFDYSSYEQQASYSAEYFSQQAKECSVESNVVSSEKTIELRACKTSSNQFASGIKIFNSLSAVQKMCVFPTVIENGQTRPIVLNPAASIDKRFLKVCGTIANTGSTATLNHAGVQGLLVVDSVNGMAFSQCLVESDFRTCAAQLAIEFAEGVLN